MSFIRFTVKTFTDDWFLIPTVRIMVNSYIYGRKSITVEVNFLCYHARWLWLEKYE